MKLANWISTVQDGPKWREFVEKAKTFNTVVMSTEGVGIGDARVT